MISASPQNPLLCHQHQSTTCYRLWRDNLLTIMATKSNVLWRHNQYGCPHVTGLSSACKHIFLFSLHSSAVLNKFLCNNLLELKWIMNPNHQRLVKPFLNWEKLIVLTMKRITHVWRLGKPFYFITLSIIVTLFHLVTK